MVKRSTGVARTVWVAKSERCQKYYCLSNNIEVDPAVPVILSLAKYLYSA